MTEEGYYTCVDCGKNHLTIDEIVWFDHDEEGEIDLSTVKCVRCWLEWIPIHLVLNFNLQTLTHKRKTMTTAKFS